MNITTPIKTSSASVSFQSLPKNLGEYGDKFYVILEGLVSVLVP
jgi:hypothetical protein